MVALRGPCLKGVGLHGSPVHLCRLDGTEASIYMFGEEDYRDKSVKKKGAALTFINLPQVCVACSSCLLVPAFTTCCAVPCRAA